MHFLAVQVTLKSLLQHHSSKASILQRSAFFTVQLSHPCMTTGKTIVLTRRTFVGKVISRLFDMLSRLVITFLPKSKHLLISWLQLPSAVILEPQKIKSDTASNVSPSIFLGCNLKNDRMISIPFQSKPFNITIIQVYIDYAKAFNCVDHNKLWKILKQIRIPECLLRNLYTGQEATVRTGHATTDWFQIGKGVCQGCILSPCLCRVHHEKCWARRNTSWN